MLHALLPIFILALALSSVTTAQEVMLQPGQSEGAHVSDGKGMRYIVDAAMGDFIRGAVDQETVDVVVRILDPQGRVLRTIDGPARGPERFQFVTDAAGAHVVEVNPFEDEAGTFVVRLDRVEPVATDPAELADQLLSAYDGEDTPGAVVAVWKDGETLFAAAYGMANLTYGIPFEVDTPTNIGSTSKQFTAFAIKLLEERKLLSLDDDVRKHIPELPDLGETVTVRHLLTHTSGYREFLNLLGLTGRRLDHGDYVDRAELIDIVQRQPALQNLPGAEFNYNNTAFGLAAVIVERVSGSTFPEFMAQEVFGPLGMTATQVRPSPEHIVAGRSVGYTLGPDGAYREIGDLGGAVGAGGIYSTVGDLQQWVENFSWHALGSPQLFDDMLTSYVLTDGEPTGYGLGLFLDEHRGLERVQHGGADSAHRSQLFYYPGIDAGLTTQSNNAAFDGSIAARLAEAFFSDHMEPEAARDDGADDDGDFDASAYDAEAFDEFVGRYALDASPSFILSFTREGDSLYTQATGQARLEIVPESETRFAIVGVPAAVSFHRNDGGQVEALTLHQNGENRATLLPDDADPPELTDFVGRFFSQELETFCTLTAEDDGLMLLQRRLDDRKLTAGSSDSFSAGGVELSFERDRNGQVIGFYASNGRTRDVRFDRLD